MRVTCGFHDQLEIVPSVSQDEVYKQIRKQLDLDLIMEQYPYRITKNDNGKWPVYQFGIGYWTESRLTKRKAPAEEHYPNEIVHNHSQGDVIPPRMYFESDWTADFDADKVKLSTDLEGAGVISFTIPHEGLWKNAKDALS